MANSKSASNDSILASIITTGDLSKLSQDQKVEYYRNFCERLGLDPISQPFKLLRLNGREILYCDRTGTQQLCKLHNVSHEIKARETVNGCYVVTCQASTPDKRHTESIGAVPVENLRGDNLSNAMMKAETKAKRRATLDLLGLGILDESETDAIPVIEAKMSAPVAAAVEEPKKEAAPAKKETTAEPVPVKKEVKKPETARVELLDALKDVRDLDGLSKLYFDNQDEVELDVQLKKMFSERKAQLERKAPVVSGNNRFASAYKTAADIEKLVGEAENVEQLTSLFTVNQKLIEKEDLKQLFSDKKVAIAKAALEAAPADAADDELATRPVEWFEKRMNKEVWMDKPSGYIGRMLIDSDDYPRWLAEEMQAEDARFRDVKADDPKIPES